MVRTYDLVELKTRSILTCVVNEAGYDIIYLQAVFDRDKNVLRVSAENVGPYTGLAIVADEQRIFLSNLQSLLYGGRTIDELKVLSDKIHLLNCDDFLF